MKDNVRRANDRAAQLEAIRAKCIEANPDREWIEVGDVVNTDDSFAPVRLADVLFIRKAFWSPRAASPENRRQATYEALEIVQKWYLSRDNLTKQSDETITFLADLLR